jgi:hypothetical protein
MSGQQPHTLLAETNGAAIAVENFSDRATESSTETAISAKCEQCARSFDPRKGSGGKPPRFCKPSCRQAWHAERNVAQHSPTCSDEIETPLVPVLPKIEQATSGDTFNWMDPDDVLISKQPCTAVYLNRNNQVVIRQEAEWNQDEDPFVHFDMHNVPLLIERLQTEYDSWRRDFAQAGR